MMARAREAKRRKALRGAVPRSEKKDEAPPPPRKKETTTEFTASMAAALVVGLFIIILNVQTFEIPSSSMERTLLIGDYLLVDRVTPAPRAKWMPFIPYETIHRGDIVVFLSPAEPGLFLVKRVIGMPGDRIHLAHGVAYRNGERLEEPYVIHSVGNYDLFRDEFPRVAAAEGHDLDRGWQLTLSGHIRDGDLVVPENCYFAMGDNRDVSRDSRYWGFVPRENIIGRPLLIFWSFNTPPDQYQKTGLADRIGFVFNVIGHFFTETRWRRMFRTVT
jgi:signal peptidase I